MEVTSGILAVKQVQAELEAAPEILRRHGIDLVVAYFGIGSAADIDELWIPHEFRVSVLLDFVQDGIERGRFEPGESDLFVKTPDGSTELHFCHESDIHLESTNEALVEEVARRWETQGFQGYRKVSEQWVPFGQSS